MEQAQINSIDTMRAKAEAENRANAENGGTKVDNPIRIPEFWRKKNKISKKLHKMLQDSANNDPVEIDTYGEYRTGTFLHRACVVELTHTDGLWSMMIYSDEKHPITDLIIREARYKFLPDRCLMAKLYPSRAEDKQLRSVVLYEIPGSLK